MARRYLVLSDLHLSDVEDHPDGWMAYKSTRFVFDADAAALLERVAAEAGPETEPVLVLNGDVFDFDVIAAVPTDPSFRVTRAERARGLEATAPRSAWKLARILGHHAGFVAALAAWLARGNRAVYVLGNHDREMHFPEVRGVLLAALHAAATAAGHDFPDAALRFEPWFYYEPGEIYVEHGNQYDYYTSFRHLLAPTVNVRGEAVLALPMGDLSNRMLMTRMGFFNPHASDYILNAYRYAAHWLKHYAFTRRNLVAAWIWGTLVTMARLLVQRRRLAHVPPAELEERARVATRFGLSSATVDALAKLHRAPITSRFFRIAREFWVDRLILALAMTGATVALALVPIPLWIKLMVPLTAFPLVFLVYEHLVEGETIFSAERALPDYARAIAALLPVRVVTFGHTHKPRVIPLDGGVCFVDTGTWAPITRRIGDATLVPGYRNYLLVDFAGTAPTVRLDCWVAPPPAARTAESVPATAVPSDDVARAA